MKIILFGAGTGLEFYLRHEHEGQEIVAVVDNGFKKINDININNPEILLNTTFDKIIITSRHYADIYQQLIDLGVAKDSIEISKLFLFFE